MSMFRRKEDDAGIEGQDNEMHGATEAMASPMPAGMSSAAKPASPAPMGGSSSAPANPVGFGGMPSSAGTTPPSSAPAASSGPVPLPPRPAPAPAPAAPNAASGFRPAASMAPAPRPAESKPASSPMGGASAAGVKSNKRILTVGPDILLKGEIATCDRLVIEGSVDAKLNDVHTVEIAETGSFKGIAEIEDAEISGLFEGELIVRNRLTIYSTGKVRGKIAYGEIEIERGGQMTGEIIIGRPDAQTKTKAA